MYLACIWKYRRNIACMCAMRSKVGSFRPVNQAHDCLPCGQQLKQRHIQHCLCLYSATKMRRSNMHYYSSSFCIWGMATGEGWSWGPSPTPFFHFSKNLGVGLPRSVLKSCSHCSHGHHVAYLGRTEQGLWGKRSDASWYVSNVSIIFDAPCLFLHHLLSVSLHLVAFLCIFQN
jgi:hypothetical protein